MLMLLRGFGKRKPTFNVVIAHGLVVVAIQHHLMPKRFPIYLSQIQIHLLLLALSKQVASGRVCVEQILSCPVLNLLKVLSVYCLIRMNETRSNVEWPPWPELKGQGGVTALTSTEMGNYYWSYCGVAIIHVEGSCLVVYICVCEYHACSNDCKFTQIYL